MNIFNKVTVQSLKKNKTRTIVTIIGIMLSTALICAVTTSVSSVFHYARDFIIYTSGDWHGDVKNTDTRTLEMINSSDRVKNAVYGQRIGFADIGSDNIYKPYIYILGAGEGFTESMPVHVTKGELPKNGSELLLPEHLAGNGGVHYEIGDTLTLEIGDRMIDGNIVEDETQNYSYRWQDDSAETYDEEIAVRETRAYTVVGFYSRPSFEAYDFPGYTALTVADELSEDYTYNVYFKMKLPDDVYAFMKENDLGYETNSQLLMVSGVTRYDGFVAMLYGLAAIFIILIMFGSVSLIYNAFSISVSERTKQFGLLSSIGATKKQLRKMVKYEAFAVSAIGIPLGILLGIGGIGVTFICIGNKFTVLSEYDKPMRLHASALSVIIACIVAFLTISISAWIPSKRATKVTAIEAIRQSTDIKTEKKPIRTPKLVYKLFGLSGMLAQKHFKRSRKKYRATIVSLFMSVVLFISASAFTSYLVNEVASGFNPMSFELGYGINPSTLEDISGLTADEFLEKINADENVAEACYIYDDYYSSYDIPTKYLTDKGLEFLGKCEYDDSRSPFWTYIYYVNDDEYKKLLDEYGLSEKEFMNEDDPTGIFCNTYSFFDNDSEKFVKFGLLDSDYAEIRGLSQQIFEDTLYFVRIDSDGNAVYVDGMADESVKYPLEEAFKEYNFKTAKTISDPPYYAKANEVSIIYPMSLFQKIKNTEETDMWLQFCIRSDDHAACYTSLKQLISEYDLPVSNLNDYAVGDEQERNLVMIIKVFAYGFIILISLIAVANVFNTVSTNVSLRRREFAMLRSVGMTSGGMRRMLNYECILYGTKALLYGLPVSAFMTYLIHRAVNNGFDSEFYMPWGAVGIAVLSVFAVVFSTMMYSMSKIRKDNPIDALKNENL